MEKYLEKLFLEGKWSRHTASEVLKLITDNSVDPLQVAALLGAMRMKEFNAEEIIGFIDVLLEKAPSLDFADINPMDVCGTGGDGKNTFNISTLSAFVIAGSGIPVAKHGNYGSTSVSGSSNVLEFFGIKFTSDEEMLRNQLAQSGICFIHAPLFHSSLKHVAPIRKALKFKTFFNVLGPLCNPAKPKVQCSGVFSKDVAELYQQVFKSKNLKSRVIFDEAGYDEISLIGDAIIYSDLGEQKVNAKDFGFEPIRAKDLSGGETIEDAAAIFINVLKGEATESQTHVVLANAAVGIQSYYAELDLNSALQRATDSLTNGKALQVFEKLKSLG